MEIIQKKKPNNFTSATDFCSIRLDGCMLIWPLTTKKHTWKCRFVQIYLSLIQAYCLLRTKDIWKIIFRFGRGRRRKKRKRPIILFEFPLTHSMHTNHIILRMFCIDALLHSAEKTVEIPQSSTGQLNAVSWNHQADYFSIK